MSMLTGQSDKLRKAALIQEEHVHYNMALADDTILSLRYRARELRAENAKLRKLAEDLHTLAYNVLPERKSDYITICSVESCIDYYSKTMPLIEQRMHKLGVKVTK